MGFLSKKESVGRLFPRMSQFLETMYFKVLSWGWKVVTRMLLHLDLIPERVCGYRSLDLANLLAFRAAYSKRSNGLPLFVKCRVISVRLKSKSERLEQILLALRNWLKRILKHLWRCVDEYCKTRTFSGDKFSLISSSKCFHSFNFTIQWQFSSRSLLK